jgi:hypothetical protein
VPDSLLDLPVRAFLDAVADRSPTPGGGSAAAVTAAVAAALTVMVARYSDVPPDEADALRVRAAALADADAAAFAAYRAALAVPETDEGRPAALERATDAAAAVPAEVAECAARIAELAGELVRTGNPNLRSDVGLRSGGGERTGLPAPAPGRRGGRVGPRPSGVGGPAMTGAVHSAELIDGRAVAEQLADEVRGELAELAERGITCGLATVLVGTDYAAAAYERRLRREAPLNCRACGAPGSRALETTTCSSGADSARSSLRCAPPLQFVVARSRRGCSRRLSEAVAVRGFGLARP